MRKNGKERVGGGERKGERGERERKKESGRWGGRENVNKQYNDDGYVGLSGKRIESGAGK